MTFGPKEVRELIAFYVDAGADALLVDAPVDRMADDTIGAASGAGPRAPASPAASATPAAIRVPQRAAARPEQPRERVFYQMPTPPSADAAVMAARDAAQTAATLDDLRALLESFDGCPLKGTATRLVFGDGNPQSRLMLVGEAPGSDEDASGVPFIGRSGKLLDLMLGAIGLDRTAAYIANVVPWRPPGNRTPTPQETAICLPFIRRQIELANPDILVCLGGPAAQTLIGIKGGITRSRGRWFTYDTGSREIPAIATFHPAFLLRSPLQKRFAWRDFLAIKKALAQPAVTDAPSQAPGPAPSSMDKE